MRDRIDRRTLLLGGGAAGIAAGGDVEVDCRFPGGNIVVEGVEGDVVRLHQDLRDTEGPWFYWYFRVRGGGGRTMRFEFTRSEAVGVRGPAVSVDGGRTWRWLGAGKGERSRFEYEFPRGAREVRFCMTIPYLEGDFERWFPARRKSRFLKRSELCRTKKGRRVELVEAGAPGGEARHRVLVTARHHACESIANFALEGLLDAVLDRGEPGDWLRENVYFAAIPFVDKDGVEDGDQGKNRRPRDHNRDYDGVSVHASVAAIRKLGASWPRGPLTMALDLHCPYLRGGEHEEVHFVGGAAKGPWEGMAEVSKILESIRQGPLPFSSKHNLPFGTSWNTEKNQAAGWSFSRWAASQEGIRAAATLEIPYANAGGVEVTPDAARALGRDLARAIRLYLGG